MSNALAVAATTATLRNLLLSHVPVVDDDLSDLEVTTQPPDLARKGITKAQLNCFLFQTRTNGAWRNMDMPRQVRPGETGNPPLALNLHYLLTAYGRGENDNDAVSHRVLGAAMSVLHDSPVLSRAEIRVALAGSDLADQFEPLKITPLPMTLEELSQLWTVFMTSYRVSTAYEITVLLIESDAPVKSPLPVLARGQADVGWPALPGGAPALREVRPPNAQPAARLGEDVVVVGEGIVAHAAARFTSTRVTPAVDLPLAAATSSEGIVHLPPKGEDPGALGRWAPGLYTVAVVVTRPGAPTIVSNEVVCALAPRITVTPTSAPAGTVELTVTCEPRIATGQRVLLVFGDRQVEPASVSSPADTSEPTTLTVSIPDVSAGSYRVRLRVDGVDSIPVVYAGTPPAPAFDAAQTVVVT